MPQTIMKICDMYTKNNEKIPKLQVKPEIILLTQVKSLTKKQKKVLNTILSFHFRYKHLWFSHETIAKQSGCCSKTVLRAFERFKELGWLISQRRYDDTSLYQIDQIFKLRSIRETLFRLLPSCWILPVFFLLSVIRSTDTKNVRLINSCYKELKYQGIKGIPEKDVGWVVKEQVVLQEDIQNVRAIMNKEFPLRKIVVNIAHKYGFTSVGMLKLMAFCDEALKDVDKHHASKIAQARDPFAYMTRLLLDWYKIRPAVNPDWHLSFKLLDLWDLKDSDPCFLKDFKEEKKPAQYPLSVVNPRYKQTNSLQPGLRSFSEVGAYPERSALQESRSADNSLKREDEGLTDNEQIQFSTRVQEEKEYFALHNQGFKAQARVHTTNTNKNAPNIFEINFHEARLGGNPENPATKKFSYRVVDGTRREASPEARAAFAAQFPPPAYTKENEKMRTTGEEYVPVKRKPLPCSPAPIDRELDWDLEAEKYEVHLKDEKHLANLRKLGLPAQNIFKEPRRIGQVIQSIIKTVPDD